MTTLHEFKAKTAKKALAEPKRGAERRRHRRHEMDHQGIAVDRWDGTRRTGQAFGQIVDLSAGGVRIVVLLALSDSGRPAYDHQLAAALVDLGVPAFACTPDLFPDLMAAALSGHDLQIWAAAHALA